MLVITMSPFIPLMHAGPILEITGKYSDALRWHPVGEQNPSFEGVDSWNVKVTHFSASMQPYCISANDLSITKHACMHVFWGLACLGHTA